MEVNSAYLEIIRLRVHQLIAYPLELIVNWAGYPFTLLIYYTVYTHVYTINPQFAGVSFPLLLVYFSIALAFRKVAESLWEGYDVEEEIKRGDILMYLTRPINYFGVRLARQLGKFIAMGIVFIPFLYIFAFWMGGTWLPIERFIPGLFLATLGGVVVFQIYHIMGLLSFWFEETWGFRRAIMVTSWLFSGTMIPLQLLPDFIQQISSILPFQYQAAIPAQFILKQAGLAQLAEATLILLTWMIVLGLLQRTLWKKGLLKHDGKG
jgi:ABC-2 type transport system permease protein